MAAEGVITYDQILISDLEIMNQATNYRNWMYRQIAPHVGKRILEIGAGIGNFTEFFQKRELVVPSDIFPDCVEYLERRFAERRNVRPLALDIAAEKAPDLVRYGFDTVVCLNVLEHIEDDDLVGTVTKPVLAPSLHLRHDSRMQNGVYLQSAGFIGDDALAQFAPVQAAVGEEICLAKEFSQSAPARRARFDHFACRLISIEDDGPAFAEHLRHRTLAAGNPTSQTDPHGDTQSSRS